VAPLFLIPLVLKNNLRMAFVVFSLAAASDFFDGYLARKFHATSDLGSMLDPVADKVLMTSSYALFAFMKYIPPYVAAVVIGRDFLILATVIACKMCDIDLKICPLMSSKINTAIQLLFVILVLACKSVAMNIPCLTELCGIVSISTIFSGVEYAQKYYWIKDKILER
jgi:cardiolipin synthase